MDVGDVEQLCSAVKVEVMKSIPESERQGIGCYANVQFGKRMEIAYDSGTLMYVNLYDDKKLDRRYKRVMSVIMKEFHMYSVTSATI